MAGVVINYFRAEKGKKIWQKFNVHFTPKHGSWLNQAELAIGMYARQCLGNDRIGSIDKLRFRTNAWNRIKNMKKTKIYWNFNKIKARKIFKYKFKQIGKD